MTEQVSEGVEQIARIALVTRALASAIDASEVVDIVVRQGMAGLDAEGGMLTFIDPSRVLMPAVAVGYTPEAIAAFFPLHLDRELPLSAAVRDQEAIWISSRADAQARFPELVAGLATPTQAWAAIPLVANGVVLGALGVSFLAEREFSEAERLFIQTLADLSALALSRHDGPLGANARSFDAIDLTHTTDIHTVWRAAAIDPRRLGLTAYWAIFEHSLDAVMFTAPDGRILAANRASCEMFRLSEDEIVAGGRAALMDPDDPRWAALLEERRRTGRVRGEVRMRRGDGTRFTGVLTSVIFDSTAGPRTCVIVHDVSERVDLIARQAQLVEEAQQLALVDELTGLRNRRGFAIAADMVLARARRDGVAIEVLFIDVDDMKGINDRFGHEAGDQALRDVAAAMDETLRAVDIAARVGGDEFVVLLHDATPADAELVVRRLTDALAARRILGREPLSASIGIATGHDDATDLASLLATADRQMYNAKARNRLRRLRRVPRTP